MSKKENNFDFNEEFDNKEEVAVEEAVNEMPEAAAAADKETYELKDGSQGSRAAYIRELFLEDNLSRKEIAEKTGFNYRVVYSATVNLNNAAEPSGRGRALTNPMIKVNAESVLAVQVEGSEEYVLVTTGEVVDAAELTEKSRNDFIKEQVEAGVSRSDIAKWLDLSYGVIYNLTKELDGTRVKHDIALDNGTTVSRSEYIRMKYAEGVSRGDIAKELDVPYSVVWQATKVEKSDAEKFADAVEVIKGFASKVANAADFEDAINALAMVEIKDAEADAAEAAEAAEIAE